MPHLLDSAIGQTLIFVHFAVLIYALISILGSKMDTPSKILWILVVACFPLVGLIIYLLLGKK